MCMCVCMWMPSLTVGTGSSRSDWSDCSSPGSYTLYTTLTATLPPNVTGNRGTIWYTEHTHTHTKSNMMQVVMLSAIPLWLLDVFGKETGIHITVFMISVLGMGFYQKCQYYLLFCNNSNLYHIIQQSVLQVFETFNSKLRLNYDYVKLIVAP